MTDRSCSDWPVAARDWVYFMGEELTRGRALASCTAGYNEQNLPLK
jgi:hypothetical protein